MHVDNARDTAPDRSAAPGRDRWRRWVTASIAAIAATAGWGGFLYVAGKDAEWTAECEASDGWFCGGYTLYVFLFVTLPLTVIAGLFFSAAYMPFGTARRLVIGIAAGLLALPAAGAGFGYAADANDASGLAVLLGVFGAVLLTFVASFWLAR